MPSKDYLMLRSAQRACPRLELGARLEGRKTVMQPFVSILAQPPGETRRWRPQIGFRSAQPILQTCHPAQACAHG